MPDTWLPFCAGSGKTVLARAAAAAAGARLLVINGPDVVSEYFGESEAGLRGVFAAARALAPSVSGSGRGKRQCNINSYTLGAARARHMACYLRLALHALGEGALPVG